MTIRYLAILSVLLIAHPKSFSQQAIVLSDSTDIPELSLDEIEIRASKDNLSLKRMPASVTLLSAKRIDETGVSTLADITALTPGFFMPDYGSKLTSPVYIRGIGSRINSPSVGLYVDHVPYFEKASYQFDFFDVERIEILKGPQGTLYGRNAMGGIINIVTRSPLEYQGTRLGINAGTYGVIGGSASHYNMAGDNFGYSLSLNFNHREGYYTNTFLNDEVDQANAVGFRSKLAWKISETTTIEHIAAFENSREGGYPYALLNDSLRVPEEISYNQPSAYNRSLFSDALVLNHRGEHVEVQATTAYQFLDDRQSIDQDFTADSAYFVVQEQQQHMVSQELIVRSPSEKRFGWLFGAYGFTQRFDKQVDVSVYQRNMQLVKAYDTDITGAALFHQSTIRDLLVKNLSLTAGIRLDFERDILDYTYDMEVAGNASNVTDTIYPDLSYTEVLPKVALTYRFGGSTVYGVIAKGYKTGGFNSTFYKEEDLFFNPEFSWNYEAGIRTGLFSNTVYADASLFYIDWKNQQIYQQAYYRDNTPAPGSLLKNAGRSVSKGGEVTLKSIPYHGFSPVISYGYTHAVFTEHEVDAETDHAGNFIPYVPRHTLTMQLNKAFRLNHSKVLDKINLNLLYRGMGEIFWNIENSYSTDYYGLLDMRISFVRGDMVFGLWGKNLLGTEYQSFYFQALGNQYVQTGKPVRFGLNINYAF